MQSVAAIASSRAIWASIIGRNVSGLAAAWTIIWMPEHLPVERIIEPDFGGQLAAGFRLQPADAAAAGTWRIVSDRALSPKSGILNFRAASTIGWYCL